MLPVANLVAVMSLVFNSIFYKNNNNDMTSYYDLTHQDYRKTSNIRRTLVYNNIVKPPVTPVGAAPSTSLFST